MNASSQPLPVVKPRSGGNIKLPAPKNMANKANPTTITSDVFLLNITPPYENVISLISSLVKNVKGPIRLSKVFIAYYNLYAMFCLFN
jgi:hypothetical protein